MKTGRRTKPAAQHIPAALYLLFLVFLIFDFAVMGLILLSFNDNTNTDDTVGYLSGSIQIRDNGGMSWFFKSCLDGSYPEIKQHPLFYILLYPFAERSMTFFTTAKLVTLVISSLAVISIFFITFYRAGPFAGMLSALLLAFGIYFRKKATIVNCEPLMLLLILWAWHFSVKGFESFRTNGKPGRNWIIAGFLAGLIYMTKPTGHAFLAAFMVSAPFIAGIRIFKSRDYWLFLVFFLLGAFPLLVRNTVAFGTPFYNLNEHVMWVDEWNEEYVMNKKPGPLDYLKQENYKHIFERMESGIRGEAGNVSRLLRVGFHPFRPESIMNAVDRMSPVPEIGFSIILLLSFLRMTRESFLFSAFLFFAFFIPMSWIYENLASSYFLLPVYPILIMMISVTVVSLAGPILQRFGSGITIVLLIFLILEGISTIRGNDFTPVSESWTTADGYWELRNWFLEYKGPPAKCIFDIYPYYEYNFDWHTLYHDMEIVHFPECRSFAELLDSMEKNEVNYLIVDKSNMKAHYDVFSSFLRLDPFKGIVIEEDPGILKPVASDPDIPVSFIVFSLEDASEFASPDTSVPQTSEKLLAQADYYFVSGKHDKSRLLLLKLCKNTDEFPINPEDLLKGARLLEKLKEYTCSEKLLMEVMKREERVETLSDVTSEATLMLAELKLNSDREGEAIPLLEKVVRKTGNRFIKDYTEALLAMEKGEPSIARNSLVDLLANDPFNAKALLLMAKACAKLDLEDEAVQAAQLCRIAVRVSPFWNRAVSMIPVIPDNDGRYEHDSGFMYIYRPEPETDQVELTTENARLVMFENGDTLDSPLVVGHDRIAAEGGGLYSHWGNIVYFSTSDNSDPNENGRSYEARIFKRVANPYLKVHLDGKGRKKGEILDPATGRPFEKRILSEDEQ